MDTCGFGRAVEKDAILVVVSLMLPIIVVPKVDGTGVTLLEPLKVERELLVVCVWNDFAVVVLRKGVTVILSLRLVEVLRKRMALVDSHAVAGAHELDDVCPTMGEVMNVVDDTSVPVVIATPELDALLPILPLEAAPAEEEDGTCCEPLLLLPAPVVTEEVLLMKGSTFREEIVLEGPTALAEMAPSVLEIITVRVSVGVTVTVLSRLILSVALPTWLPACLELSTLLSVSEAKVAVLASDDCVARLGTILDDVVMISVALRFPAIPPGDPIWLESETVAVHIPGPRKSLVALALLPNTAWVLAKSLEYLAAEIGILFVAIVFVVARVPPILCEDPPRLELEAMAVEVLGLLTVVASFGPVSAPLGTTVIIDVMRVLEPKPSIVVDGGIVAFPNASLCVAGAVAAPELVTS